MPSRPSTAERSRSDEEMKDKQKQSKTLKRPLSAKSESDYLDMVEVMKNVLQPQTMSEQTLTPGNAKNFNLSTIKESTTTSPREDEPDNEYFEEDDDKHSTSDPLRADVIKQLGEKKFSRAYTILKVAHEEDDMNPEEEENIKANVKEIVGEDDSELYQTLLQLVVSDCVTADGHS